MEESGVVKNTPCKDKRCYKCDFCDVVRSKRALIRAHMVAAHEDEMKELGTDEENGRKENICELCSASFRKPAYLKQHMLSHTVERPFPCPMDGCPMRYARKDHLNRHMLKHQGEIYPCPVEGCSSMFRIKSNIARHVIEFHQDGKQCRRKELHICEEANCVKAFPYPSKLKRHEDSHVKLDSTEVACGEPGCLKMFSNADCLRAHTLSCHQYKVCEICGTKQLKKNMKRHQRMHEAIVNERVKCSTTECECSYSKKSNLTTHIKACHEHGRTFICRFQGCGKKFAYKHVRNNHEKSSLHVHVHGDFEAADEERQLRNKGSLKRLSVSIESLARKQVTSLGEAVALETASEYMHWVLS